MRSGHASDRKTGRLRDTAHRYGWLSIALHWAVAAAVIAMWFLGQAIGSAGPDTAGELRALHVSIGLAVWLLVAARIAWRVMSGHPQVQGLGDGWFRIARAAHYLLLLLLATMLLTGPLLALSAGHPLILFPDIVLVPAGCPRPSLLNLASTLHAGAATALALLTLLHVAGAFKHLMFHDDDTFAGILRPGDDSSADVSGSRASSEMPYDQQRSHPEA